MTPMRLCMGAVLTMLVVLVMATAVTSATAQPSDPPTVAPSTVETPLVETPEVAGAANPLQAPALGLGVVTDTILATEVLWYLAPAQPGQDLTVSVTIEGRVDGPALDGSVIEVTVHDAQRQPVATSSGPVDGQRDQTVTVGPVTLPSVTDQVDGVQPPALVSVAFMTPSPADPTAYRLHLRTTVTGTPDPSALATDGAEQPGTAPDAAAVDSEPGDGTAASADDPSSDLDGDRPPDLVGDLLPVALMALAIGGVGGFELSRRGL